MSKLFDPIEELRERMRQLEDAVTTIGYHSKASKKERFKGKKQASVYNGMSRAFCVETVDPWKQNRVRFFHPMLHDPTTKLLNLPFANPVSSMGGFDDCGLSWVPPAGSTLILLFEGGHRKAPFYIGTTWHRHRGANGTGNPFPSREYEEIYQGHRKGYLLGPGGDPNSEDQVLPPWNTESYNGFDIDNTEDFFEDTNQHKQITAPNIYGFKTPEKHMLKMTDGNPKCNRKWKRLEIQSGCGNYMVFKDDHLHYGGQWSNPKCNPKPGGAPIDICSEHDDSSQFGSTPFFTDLFGKPIEKDAECEGNKQSSNILGGHSSTPGNPPNKPTKYVDSQTGSNSFFKHRNECRPVKGPGTPQNNRIDLPQTGIQFISISGHTMVMDDSVEEPRGKPEWERSMDDFDYGCNDKYLGVFYIKSSTGHSLVMSDVEEDTKLRGDQNYVELRSASGNSIQLNDHTTGQPNTDSCPPNLAGERRGVHITSTSNHQIQMIDHMNEQCSPARMEGGQPVSKATRAFMSFKSGYGLSMRLSDDFSQEETQNQYIEIKNPQCKDPNTDQNCNSCESDECRGPHFLRFDGRPKGEPGLVFLRAGGHSIRQTYDMDIVLVGDKEKNPSDKFTYVSKKFITSTEDVHFRYSGELHIFFAEKQILLMAGRDCPPSPENPEGCKGPCLYNVIVARCPVRCPITLMIHWTEKAASERVFASAYHPCRAGCGGGCDEFESQMAEASEPPDC